MAAKVKKESTHNVEFAKGGNQHMFGEQAADAMAPGTTRDKTATDSGTKLGSSPGAKGGTTKMFGFRPSNAAKAGQTGVD